MDCNILLLGQTGVGKSALLNYLADETLAESGISATTGGVTRGINKYRINLNGQACQISDSEGLELTHEKEWRELVDDELFSEKEHDKISSWYHIIIFCIGANSRVQDFELSLIDDIIKSNYGVIIALTKADLVTEDELSTIEEDVKEHFEDSSLLRLIPVCSVQRRNNRLEGKEEIAEAIIESWEKTIINRLPEHIYYPIYDQLEKWFDKTFTWLSEEKIGLFQKSKNDVLTALNTRIKIIVDNINRTIKNRQTEAFKEISAVNKALGQVLDLKSITSPTSSLALKIEKLDSSFVFEDNTGKSIAMAGGLAAISFILPGIGVALATIGVLAKSIFGMSPIEELQSALHYQYRTLVKLYSEREIVYEYVLADMLGYYYGTREVAIAALKGRGMEKNSDLFSEKIEEVENTLTEYDLEDGRGEYYLAYYYFSPYSGETKRNLQKAKNWLRLSVSHNYPDALEVNQFGDIFSRMSLQEKKDEEEINNYWYGE